MYFDFVDVYEELIFYLVQGIGFDFVYDKGRNLEQLKIYGFLIDKVLVVGVIDGCNIWKVDFEECFDVVFDIFSIVKVDELWIQFFSSLLYVLVVKYFDEYLEKDLLNGLFYVKEKLVELIVLKEGLVLGKVVISEQIQQVKVDIQVFKQFVISVNFE